jgi:hypothetical protein
MSEVNLINLIPPGMNPVAPVANPPPLPLQDAKTILQEFQQTVKENSEIVNKLLKAFGHTNQVDSKKPNAVPSPIPKKAGNDTTLMRESFIFSPNSRFPAYLGADGDPSDDDGDSSDDISRNPNIERRRSRRRSITSRIAAQANTPRHRILMTQSPPSYEHIRLDRLTLGKIFKFISSINEYQIAHGVSIPVTALVGERVRELIMAHHRGLTEPKFFKLSTEELINYLLQEVRPRTNLQFRKAMEMYARFEYTGKDKPGATNFKSFYDDLLIYRNRFIKVYDVLSEDNEDVIPPITNKEGGLIKVFLDAIPQKYGKHVYENLKNKRYDFIHDFLREFFEIVNDHYEQYEDNRVFNQHFEDSESKHGDGKSTSFNSYNSKPPLKVRFGQSKSVPVSHSRRSTFKPNAHKLGAIEDEALDSVADTEHSDTGDYGADEVSGVDTVEDMEEANSTSEAEVLAAISNSTSKPVPKSISTERFPKSVDSKNKPKGCFQLLFFGQCKNGSKCTYAHDKATLNAAHSTYLELLNRSEFKTSTSQNSSAQQRQPHRLQELIQDEESEEEVEYLAMIQHEVSNAVMPDLPEASLAKAVHHVGVVATSDGSDLVIKNVLFDTGAVHGNYVTQSFVLKNYNALKSFRESRKNRVRLADKKTVVEINEAYVLSITFKDRNGSPHTGESLFWVLPESNHEMIIGLPAIIKHYSIILTQMIETAAVRFQDCSSPTECQLTSISDLQTPWTLVPEAEAPEDMATDLPCSFTYALHYLEMPYEQAVEEYHGLFEKHIAKEFADSTEVIQLLKTKGVLVFVPQNWEGIKHVPPVELTFKEGMPSRLKPKARPVNPKVFAPAKAELERLDGYFYRDSTSSIASCIVVAPKATPPYVRICGDYTPINPYIETGHYPIPIVTKELDKILKFPIKLDIDLANAFHQIPLSPKTSSMLSVVTPWKQVEPKFLPEGVGPASFILQKYMADIFKEVIEEGWVILIFDNLLILAMDYQDAFDKLNKVLDICIHFNIYLKFAKTWLGFKEVSFFGYQCKENSYELSNDRKETIQKFPFPDTKKKMQSFLGTALFFKNFVPHYSSKAALLYNMTKNGFNWAQDSWKHDYNSIFEDFKNSLLASMAVYYPDYELDWILRTDASRFGIGAVLLQMKATEDGIDFQPIGFFSEKFSDQATRWSTIEQEAYGIYAAVKHFAYYLHAKTFIIETDHQNLLFMEMSVSPKITRWRVYLQSFVFMLRHISGKANVVADWLSRVHEKDDLPVVPKILAALESDLPPTNPTDVLKQVHGGRIGHWGARRTWKLLNEQFPGHKIPYRFVEEFIATCAICQKDRLGMVDGIEPIVRVLKPEHRRSVVGVDTLTVTPPDEDGYSYIIVIVNHFTKFSYLYPTKNKDATSIAEALFSYFCNFGLVDSILTDPGTEFMNEVVATLHKYLGVKHVFSLVQRHQSNGAEGTNKQILRHLKTLVFDERTLRRWRKLLPLVQWFLNSFDNSETGIIPFHAHFGSEDRIYMKMPEEGDGAALTQAYVKALDEDLQHYYQLSKKFQDVLVNQRTKSTPPDKQNLYQAGDLVLFRQNPEEHLPFKLSPKFLGPYQVIQQIKNDVTAKHVISGRIQVFHVERLKIFHGSLLEAKEIAKVDDDQSTIKSISVYRGDPNIRSTMQFLVEFEDGVKHWLPYGKDINSTSYFEEFCKSTPELAPLLLDLDTLKTVEKNERNSIIAGAKPGDIIFVDLRYFGHIWYDQGLDLPDKDSTLYLVQGTYLMYENKQKTKISVKFPILKETRNVNNNFIKRYGYRKNLPTSAYKLVDEALIKAYPSILADSSNSKTAANKKAKSN